MLVLTLLPLFLEDSELEYCEPKTLALVIGGGGNISSGDGSSNTDDIGDRVGEGKKQIEPVFNWLGEINVGVFKVVELDNDAKPFDVKLVGVVC